jgi:hypothetical protein
MENEVKSCVAFILLTVVRKIGAVLRSDNFVVSAKIVLRANAIFRLVAVMSASGVLC